MVQTKQSIFQFSQESNQASKNKIKTWCEYQVGNKDYKATKWEQSISDLKSLLMISWSYSANYYRGNVVQIQQFIAESSPKYNVVNILSLISLKHIVHCYYYLLKRQHGSNQAVHISIFVSRSLISRLLNLKVAMANFVWNFNILRT